MTPETQLTQCQSELADLRRKLAEAQSEVERLKRLTAKQAQDIQALRINVAGFVRNRQSMSRLDMIPADQTV